MQCPNCETENRDEAKFCDECGFPLSGAIARAGGAASPKGSGRSSYENAQDTEWITLDDAPADGQAGGKDDAKRTSMPSDEWHYGDFDGFDVFPTSDSFDPIVADQVFDERGEITATHDDFGRIETTAEHAEPLTQTLEPVSAMSSQRPVKLEEETAPAGVREGWPEGYTMEMPKVDQDGPVEARDFRLDSARPQRSRKKVLAFVLAGIVVGAIIAAIVTYAAGLWGGITVPDVTGMTEADAQAALAEEGFSVRTTQVKSDDTEGLVLIMDPRAGSRAPEGSEVVIHIATARFIPDVVGTNADDAKKQLEEAGYENIRYEMQKSDGDENVVLEISPEAGARAKSNAEVVVKISEAYTVPSIDGLDAQAAYDAISEAGLTPEIVYIDTDQFVDGTVMGTNPEPGTKVAGGDYVTISVSRARGVELVNLTESMFAQGNTVTIGGVDYEIESLVSVSYQGDDTVAFTATGKPKITFFGETLYASSSQTVSGTVAWSEGNEVVGIY